MPETTAYHEAGHVFMAVHLGAQVQSVSIEPDRDDGPQRHGDTRIQWDLAQVSQRELHEKSVLVALAGPVAEMLHRGEPYHPGLVAEWAADWREAWKAAAWLVPGERARLEYLERLVTDLYRLLNRDDCWAALAMIVDHLLAHETLDGDMVNDIVADWMN